VITRSQIETWCREEAERCGCTLVDQSGDGLFVKLLADIDAVKVVLRSDGPHGERFCAVIVEHVDHVAYEDLVRSDVARAAEAASSAARIPANVPIIVIGHDCPIHRRPITMVDRSAKRFACEVEKEHSFPAESAFCSRGDL
jgi:hypothetical protein